MGFCNREQLHSGFCANYYWDELDHSSMCSGLIKMFYVCMLHCNYRGVWNSQPWKRNSPCKGCQWKLWEKILILCDEITLEAQTEIQGPGLALLRQVPPQAHRLLSLSVRFLISHMRSVNCATCLSGPLFILIFPVHWGPRLDSLESHSASDITSARVKTVVIAPWIPQATDSLGN